MTFPQCFGHVLDIAADIVLHGGTDRLMPHQYHQVGWHDSSGPTFAEESARVLRTRILYVALLGIGGHFHSGLSTNVAD